MTTRFSRIEQTLESSFAPIKLEITDESAKHASHTARTGITGGETHYNLLLVSNAFAGLPRLARHRAVNEALAPEFKSGLHALSLTLLTPAEAEKAAA